MRAFCLPPALALRQNFSVPRHLSLYAYETQLLESVFKAIVPLPEACRNRPVPPVTANAMVKPSQGLLKSVLLTLAVMLLPGSRLFVSVAEPVTFREPQYQITLICSLLECKNFAFPMPLYVYVAVAEQSPDLL
jgi:hypothetical protein